MRCGIRGNGCGDVDVGSWCSQTELVRCSSRLSPPSRPPSRVGPRNAPPARSSRHGTTTHRSVHTRTAQRKHVWKREETTSPAKTPRQQQSPWSINDSVGKREGEEDLGRNQSRWTPLTAHHSQEMVKVVLGNQLTLCSLQFV